MTSNQGQFNVKVWEGDRLLNTQQIDDPFIRTVIKPHGWRAFWALLTGQMVYTVSVTGNHNAVYRAVMTADYTPDPPREPRVSESDQCAMTPEAP